jgi:hypothetical protein
MDPQVASPIFNKLPGELRNAIYTLAMTSTTPLTDPSNPPSTNGLSIPTRHHYIPKLGVSLQRTCKRIYNELPTYTLYASNRFRFTSSTSAHRFLDTLSKEQAAHIQDVEVDLRDVSDTHPSVEREWVQYMCWATESSVTGIWARKLGGLRIDTPGLKTLRLNIEGWQRSATLRGVSILRDLLQSVDGLQRVVVTGTDGSLLLAGAKEKFLQQWGPVVFVGVMRFARLTGMVESMARCVKGTVEQKVVRWSQKERVVTLEIMTWSLFVKETGSTDLKSAGALRCCPLVEYEQRWHSNQWPGTSQ